MSVSLRSLFSHLEKIPNLDLSQHMEIVRGAEKKGMELYKTIPEFRDLSTLMEHPEFYKIYYVYMQNFEKFKRMMVLMKLYDIISHELYRRDPEERYHNSYHKLVILYNLIRSPTFSRILLPKEKSNRLAIEDVSVD